MRELQTTASLDSMFSTPTMADLGATWAPEETEGGSPYIAVTIPLHRGSLQANTILLRNMGETSSYLAEDPRTRFVAVGSTAQVAILRVLAHLGIAVDSPSPSSAAA